MFSALAVGEPSWGRFTDGRFDFTPLLVTAVALLLLKIFFGFRMRWQLILGTVLAAPLLVGLSGHISYPLTTASLLATGAVVSFVTRRRGSSGWPPT
jgi:hypothetical protein